MPRRVLVAVGVNGTIGTRGRASARTRLAAVVAAFTLLWSLSGGVASAGAAPITSLGPAVATGRNPHSIAYSPTGRLLASANSDDNTVSVFSVGPAGALTQVGSPVATGEFPAAVAFNPTGSVLVVTNFYGDSLSVFSVDSSGKLTAVGSPIVTPAPNGEAFSSDGKLLAVPNLTSSGTVSMFSLDAAGKLTQVGPPTSTGLYSSPTGVAFSATRRQLAVANRGSSTVLMFAVDSTGHLTPIGSPVATGPNPGAAAFSPDGNLLTIANSTGPSVSVFTVDAAGKLTAVGTPTATGTRPSDVKFSSGGGLLAVANAGASTVSVFSVAAGGALSELSGSPFATGAAPLSVAFSPAGGLIATANSGANNISRFAIQPPSVTISSPVDGGVYSPGQVISAAYSCAAGATPVVTCKGPVASGQPVDTAGVGSHTFAVSATDVEGMKAAQTVTYTVKASPPTAAVSVVTPHPTAGAPLTLSAAGSLPGSGHIISYDWDFAGAGRFTTSTGTNPLARFSFRAGVHGVLVKVVNSNGASATKQLTFSVPTAAASGRVGCNSELDLGSVQILVDGCVKKNRRGSGYDITASDIDFNGMNLVTLDGKQASFTLSVSSAGAFLSGPPVRAVLRNTPAGDLNLGGIDLNATPLDLSGATASTASTAALPPNSLTPQTLTGKAGIRIVTFAVGHPCAPGVGGSVTCCPKAGKQVKCATLPGGFPLAGMVTVYVNPGKKNLVVVANAALDLPQFGLQATGGVQILADLKTGIHLNGLEFGVPSAGLGFLRLKDALFSYYLPDYRDPKTGSTALADSWNAHATLSLGGAQERFSVMGDLGFKQGSFDHGSAFLQLPRGSGIPLFPGVLVNGIGANIARTPVLSFGGSLGASIGEAFQLTATFQYGAPSPTTLGYVGAQGLLDFQGQRIASLTGEAFSDGFFDAALKIDLHFPLDAASDSDAKVVLRGGLSFWDETASGRFQGVGDVHIKLFKYVNADARGMISRGADPQDRSALILSGCVELSPLGGASGWYNASTRDYGGHLFVASNCKSQLSSYTAHPLIKHCGKFSSSPTGCIARSTGTTFRLHTGLEGEELRLHASGTPVVKVTSPGGRSFTTPTTTDGNPTGVPGQYMVSLGPKPGELTILLIHPQAGIWRVDATPGAPAPSKVEFASESPPAAIHASVRRGPRRSFVLTYRVTRFVPGSTIRFVERGRDSTHVIGTVRRAGGSLSFVPEEAVGRTRRIEADLAGADGIPSTVAVVARYRALAPVRGGKPGRVRFVRRGINAIASWGAAANARFYDVTVRGSDGRTTQFRTRSTQRRVTIGQALAFQSFTVSVKAEGGSALLTGPGATGRLRATTSHQPRPPKHTRKLRHLPGRLTG